MASVEAPAAPSAPDTELQRIHGLAADARWLDALDALEAHEASHGREEAAVSPEGSDEIDEIRARGAAFRRARAATAADSAGEDGGGAWIAGHEAFGVTTSYRYDADGLLWLRTSGEMRDIDLFHTVAVLRQVELFGEWVPFLRGARVLKEVDFSRLLAFFTIGVRGILNRDCVLRVAACNDALASGSLFFEGRSLDDGADRWRGAPVPPRKTGWFSDRMFVHSFFGRVAFLSRRSQHCHIVVSVDLRTVLPRAILDFFLKKLVGLFLALWRRQSRRVSADPKCPHQLAIAADPAFYDAWLLPKYLEFCKTRGWEEEDDDDSAVLDADDVALDPDADAAAAADLAAA